MLIEQLKSAKRSDFSSLLVTETTQLQLVDLYIPKYAVAIK